MDKVLTYLVVNLSFLYKNFDFKIVDSVHSDEFGENGLILLQSECLFIKLTNDRGQLFLDVRNCELCKAEEWYSSDLVWQLLKGEIVDSAVLDDKIYPKFFRENFSRIFDCLTHATATEKFELMKKMKKERAKRLFG